MLGTRGVEGDAGGIGETTRGPSAAQRIHSRREIVESSI
jgi:hypothetical protein